LTSVVNIKHEPYDVLICRPSKWGNPFTHIKSGVTNAKFIVGSREEAIIKYEEYLLGNPYLMSCLYELNGKRLGCVCKPNSCHGDVLIKHINKNNILKLIK
jgi:hypothetical protein